MADDNLLSGIFGFMMGLIYLILAIIDGVGQIAIEIARNWPRRRRAFTRPQTSLLDIFRGDHIYR